MGDNGIQKHGLAAGSGTSAAPEVHELGSGVGGELGWWCLCPIPTPAAFLGMEFLSFLYQRAEVQPLPHCLIHLLVPFSLVLGSVVIIDSVHPPLPAPLHPNHLSEGGFQLGDSCLQSFCCSQFHLGMQWGEGTEGTGWEGTQTARAARSVGKHPDPFPCSQMPGTAWPCLADGTIECLEFCQLKMCKLEVISVPIKSQDP